VKNTLKAAGAGGKIRRPPLFIEKTTTVLSGEKYAFLDYAVESTYNNDTFHLISP
jgi:hypothetical protein